MSPTPSPEELLDGLCVAYPRRAVSLRRMFAVCSNAMARGDTNFSAAQVARWCAQPRFQGDETGPVEGSIRNAGGEPYQVLIRAFAEMTAPLRKIGGKTRPRRITSLETALQRADPLLRIHIAKLEADLLRVQQAVRREPVAPLILPNALKTPLPQLTLASSPSAPIGVPTAPVASLRRPPAQVTAPSSRLPQLSPIEVSALRACVSPQALKAQGLRADAAGRILDEDDITVQQAGFRSAVEKVLAILALPAS